MIRPVLNIQIDGSWLMWSVCIERMTVRSSTQPARWGSSSLTAIPDSPYRPYRNGLRIKAPAFWASMASTTPGCGRPSRRSSTGLGSSRSRWLGPPGMKSWMTDFARGRR